LVRARAQGAQSLEFVETAVEAALDAGLPEGEGVEGFEGAGVVEQVREVGVQEVGFLAAAPLGPPEGGGVSSRKRGIRTDRARLEDYRLGWP